MTGRRNIKAAGTTCAVQLCERAVHARGFCRIHYTRNLRHGDPLGMRPRPISPLPAITSPTELARVLGVSRQRAHQLLYRQRHAARKKVNDALRAGTLTKPDGCERCDALTTDLEAHHWDYREELDVRWLCVGCHNIVHSHAPHSLSRQKAVV